MNTLTRIIAALVLAGTATALSAQVLAPFPTEPELPPATDERLQLAISNPAYPVTPGDVYLLTFLQGVDLLFVAADVVHDFRIYQQANLEHRAAARFGRNRDIATIASNQPVAD